MHGLALLDLRLGERVLEIGPGTGALLVELARRAGAAWGVDLSLGMCRVAQARLARARVSSSAAALCGDAERLPFATGAFDAIFMSFTLELFDNEVAAWVLAECGRVLAANGRLGVIAMERRGRATLITRLYDWAGQRFPQWIDCHPIPLADTLLGNGFRPSNVTQGAIGGLPMAIVIAQKIGS
jgi:demethylmenaquinone methyltransferase/2-methoxy-6-polyprenyl-1,4-benzoquinol methylase